jgi:hypothetical protein
MRTSHSQSIRTSRGRPRARGSRPVGRSIDLSPALCVLLDALTTDTRSAASVGHSSDDLVSYKTAGYLVSRLGASLDRLVTRRALHRYLTALRRRLDHASADALIIQRKRWLGWRAVPRAAAGRRNAPAHRAM